MTVSSGSLLRAMRVPSRSENSRSQAVQRSRSMCLCVPVHDRCAMLPPPGRLHCAHCGFGHANRVYLSWTGVVSVIVVLLCTGLDQKILIRRQFFHVTILQDYRILDWFHIAQKFQQVKNALGEALAASLESAKWKLWHGHADDALIKLALLRDNVSEEGQRSKLTGLYEYLHRNQAYVVNYDGR